MFMFCKKCKKEITNGSVFCSWCGKKQVTERAKPVTHRRSRGTGTIRIDRRKRSPYVVYAPRSANSSSQQYLCSFKTRKEAQEYLDSYNQETFPDLYNATLSKIYELWSKNHFLTLSKSGVQGYQAAYKSISSLSNIKMRNLKTVDFQRCIDAQAELGASRSKLEKIKQLCSQLCKYSMENDILDKNYAEFIKLTKKEKKEKSIFTENDLRILWNHTTDFRVQIILVMIYTGFRIGEIANLKTSDVYLEKGYMIGGEKTEAGINRIVPFPPEIPEIQEFVTEWIAKCTTKTLIGETAEYVRKYMFYPCLAELGLIDPPIKSEKTGKDMYVNPRLTPHCTRHTFATLSVNVGMKPENLQKIIGHADFSTTANIYVHKDFEILKEDMSKLRKY